MNEGFTGLERHEGNWNIFHFWVNYPFNPYNLTGIFQDICIQIIFCMMNRSKWAFILHTYTD